MATWCLVGFFACWFREVWIFFTKLSHFFEKSAISAIGGMAGLGLVEGLWAALVQSVFVLLTGMGVVISVVSEREREDKVFRSLLAIVLFPGIWWTPTRM